MDQEKNLNIQINEQLLKYALVLPIHNINIEEVLKISALLKSPIIKIEEIEAMIERILMLPHARAMWIENRLQLIPDFKDICPIVDYAYVSYGRGNHIGAYFSLMPVIEGIILRWRGLPTKINRKPSFKEIEIWMRNKSQDGQLLSSHPFFPIWIDAIFKILFDEFFQDTTKNYTRIYFNRHDCAHLMKEFSLSVIKGLVMRIFIILELLVEIYVVENKYTVGNTQLPLLFKTSQETEKRFLAYKLAYDWCTKDFQQHPEAILSSMYC